DFDENDNFYGGGEKSDLYVLPASGGNIKSGLYKNHSFKSLRVYDGFVYFIAENVRAKEEDIAIGIWRHQIIDANGTLGDQELVMDWANDAGDYTESVPNYFTFSQDGIMMVGTDNINPILMVDTSDGTLDVMYKGILSTSVEFLVWGTGNYLYQIKGGESWDVMRIDMGASGAPYYGR
ncbi:hypothetical protein ACFL4L_06990, partial [bacterium]